jgi:hypothetical protein
MGNCRRFCWLTLVTAIAPLVAQDLHPLARQRLREENRIIELDWRRDSVGDLEYAPAGAKNPEFQKLFAKGLWHAFQTTGFCGPLSMLVHRGDLLSMTDAERHLGRIHVGGSDEALLQFVRRPAVTAETDALDRMVAIDLLRRHGGASATAALRQIADDDKLAPALRERAVAAAPVRARLDAASMLLPAKADLYVVLEHDKLLDAHFLTELGYLTGLISSTKVIETLKQPFESDYVLGQAESEVVTEVGFEFTRRLGSIRFDHTCIALQMPSASNPKGAWSLSAAGSFPAETIGRVLPMLGVENLRYEVTSALAKAVWDGGSIAVTDKLVTAQSAHGALGPQPQLAASLLNTGGAGLRFHVPRDSTLLPTLRIMFGMGDLLEIDATLSFGDQAINLQATLTTKDELAAADLAESLQKQVDTMREQLKAADSPMQTLVARANDGVVELATKANAVVLRKATRYANLPKWGELRELLFRMLR